MDSCAAYLQSGGSLLLFPEGTRSKQGEELDFKLGAATVASRSGVDVLPVAIACKPLFLSKEQPWYFVPDARPAFTISILAPVPASEFATDEAGERHARHALNAKLLKTINSELTGMEFC